MTTTEASTGSFYSENAGHIKDLFSALERAHQWSKSLEGLIDYTQAKWVGKEHGNSVEKDQFTDEQTQAAMPIFSQMGLRDEILPTSGNYEQIVVVGGLMRVNRKNMGFTKQHINSGLVATSKVVFWAGERLRDERENAEMAAVDLSGLKHHAWVRNEARKPVPPGSNSRFATETDLARLAYLERFPYAQQVGSDYLRLLKYLDKGFPEFTLLDAPRVYRPIGEPRHTTASCTEEWLKLVTPKKNANILLIAGNPHSRRILNDIKQVTARSERSDINFMVSGPEANPNASIQLYLGEIGRMLFAEAQELVSAS